MGHGWKNLTEQDQETILRGIRDVTPQGGPFHLEFDWTDRCNVHCFFCHNDLRNATQQDLPPEIVRDCVVYAKERGLRSVRLSGGGEPLFHRRIQECLDVLVEHDVTIDNLTTNAVLLLPESCEKMLAAGLDEVIVSLNYVDAKSYGQCMETNEKNFDRALEGLRRLRGMDPPPGKPRPHITVQFTLHSVTKFQIPEMYALGRDLEADTILIRDLYNVSDDQRIPERDKERVRQDLREAVRKDEGSGRLVVGLGHEGLNRAYEEVMEEFLASRGAPVPQRKKNEYCYMPWYSAAIRGTGDVFACCMLMIDETAKPLGNVRQESLESVWTGPGYQRIREEMERVTLCKTNMNPAKQDFEFLAPVCTQHYGCSLSCSLTAEDFFAAAERIHQAKRRSPRGILTQIKHGRPLRRNTNGPHLNGNGH